MNPFVALFVAFCSGNILWQESNVANPKSGVEISFRVGRVKAYRRGKVWYLYYFENGQRRRPRIGPSQTAAKRMAAQINGQLETGAPGELSFEPISIDELRSAWLNHHETVRRSSLSTINRYRTATDHFLRFLERQPIRVASHFRVCHAEEFVGYLRSLRVAPNGHAHSAKRPLLDKGILFILEACRALFTYAAKRRHMPPYAENPFSALELGKMPVDHRRAISLPNGDQVVAFLEALDDWSFAIFVTLALTGLRPGELVHLLVEDFDPKDGLLHIRNRPELGWQVKTRRDRTLPLLVSHTRILKRMLGSRACGTLFARIQFSANTIPSWATSSTSIAAELRHQEQTQESIIGRPLSRSEQSVICRRIWWKLGMVKTDQIRTRLMRHSKTSGIHELATPKIFRHTFATTLQEGRVDPLIRNELLGHIPEDGPRSGGGLGMTANYTHTRIETKRAQLEDAFRQHPIRVLLEKRLCNSEPEVA